MWSSMDHLFWLRVRHVLILVPASLRDLHRHSCRHFHFHFWLSLRRSYLHFVSRWISFLSPPSLARAFVRFCFPLFSSIFFYLSFPFFLSFPAFFSPPLLPFFAARIFFSRERWNMRARKSRRLLALRFSASPSRPRDLLEASPGATRRGPWENERISATAPREIDELRTARSKRKQRKGRRRRNVKFRELIRSIGVSEVARRAFKGPAAVFIELAKVNLLAPRKLGHRHCVAWSKQDKQPFHDDLEKKKQKKHGPDYESSKKIFIKSLSDSDV